MGLFPAGIGDNAEDRDSACMTGRTSTTWHIWNTCSTDGLDHAVTDEQMATEIAERAGQYPAVCGHTVLAASMTCPPGPRCPSCLAFLHTLPAPGTDDHHKALGHRKPGLLSRLLRRGR